VVTPHDNEESGKENGKVAASPLGASFNTRFRKGTVSFDAGCCRRTLSLLKDREEDLPGC
jgi:hypothetical protein